MAAEKEVVIRGILSQIDELHSAIVSQDWKTLSRTEFITVLEKSISLLSQLKESFETAQKTLQAEVAGEKPELKELLLELEKNMLLLQKNHAFELQKKSRAKEINILEREETPDVYAIIEQKLLAFLLRARYAAERINIFLRKAQPSDFRMERGTAKSLLSLLERKETEFQDLKGKYEDVRKRSYIGYLEEQTVSDLELQVNETAKNISTDIEKLSHNISMHEKQLDFMQTNYAELKQRINAAEEKLNDFIQKSLELASMLKKERDYAKRIVLEIEHETVQLRNTYTRELLSLEEEKAKARKEAEKKFGETLTGLQKALEKTEKDAEHFREISIERKERIKGLEEKISEINLKKESSKTKFEKTQKKKKEKKTGEKHHSK